MQDKIYLMLHLIKFVVYKYTLILKLMPVKHVRGQGQHIGAGAYLTLCYILLYFYTSRCLGKKGH